MNSITHTISGLASSLFLNVGLTQIALKLDPVTKSKLDTATNALSCEMCTAPCGFTKETGQ